jgi:hypothetical protein
MTNLFLDFLNDERSQDTLGFALVLSGVVMIGLAVYSGDVRGLSGVWASGNSLRATANIAAG